MCNHQGAAFGAESMKLEPQSQCDCTVCSSRQPLPPLCFKASSYHGDGMGRQLPPEAGAGERLHPPATVKEPPQHRKHSIPILYSIRARVFQLHPTNPPCARACTRVRHPAGPCDAFMGRCGWSGRSLVSCCSSVAWIHLTLCNFVHLT